mgnify:FL=1
MAMTMNPASSVPPGWHYDASMDQYVDSIGRYVTRQDADTYGSIIQAIVAIHGSQALQGAYGAIRGSNQMATPPGAKGPAGPYSIHSTGKTPPANPNVGDLWNDDTTGEMMVYTSIGWVNASKNLTTGGNVRAAINSAGSLSVGNAQPLTFHQPPTSVISIETKVGRVSVDIETGDITVPVGIGRDEAIREFWFGFQKYFQPSSKAKYEKEILGLKADYRKLETYYKEKLVNIEKDAAKPIVERVRKKYGSEKFIMVKPEDLIKFIEEA